MNDIVHINEASIVAFLNSGKGGIEIGKPFSRQIFLLSASIAGLYYVDNINNLLDAVKIGTKLRFLREPENEHDDLAILVKDQNDNKLGYVPRAENPILARLMDAGKLIFGTVKTIDNDDNFINVEMEIFMDD